MSTCERCGKKLPSDAAECPGCAAEASAKIGLGSRRGFNISFTGKLSILILVFAFATALVLYEKELTYFVQRNAIADAVADINVHSALSDQEVESLREGIIFYFILFSLPLLPLWGFAGAKPAQVVIAVVSALMLLAAFAASSDDGGCADCMQLMVYIVAATALFSLLAIVRSIWRTWSD